MRRIHGPFGVLAVLFLAATTMPGFTRGNDDDSDYDDRDKFAFEADLDGFQQVPSFSTAGSGQVRLKLNASEDEAEYELSYGELAGSVVLFAHLHFGRPGANGGVIAFLCSSSPPRAGVPACPNSPGGSASGSLDASRVVGPIGQGIARGDFEVLVRALRAGSTYVNVHTNASSPGEVRGNVTARAGSDREPKKKKKKASNRGTEKKHSALPAPSRTDLVLDTAWCISPVTPTPLPGSDALRASLAPTPSAPATSR